MVHQITFYAFISGGSRVPRSCFCLRGYIEMKSSFCGRRNYSNQDNKSKIVTEHCYPIEKRNLKVVVLPVFFFVVENIKQRIQVLDDIIAAKINNGIKLGFSL